MMEDQYFSPAAHHPDMSPHPDMFAATDLGPFENSWEFEAGLADLLRTSAEPEENGWSAVPHEPPVPPVAMATVSRRHRRRRRWLAWVRRPTPVVWLRWVSLLFAATTAVIVAMLSVLGGMISYAPLQHLAERAVPHDLAPWWPLLVYGPWLVASLSILRAALHQRRAAHSWAVVVLFSFIAVYLCVAHATQSMTSMAVACLPPITALVSFHQLVRQITLTNPPRHAAVPKQRGTGQRG